MTEINTRADAEKAIERGSKLSALLTGAEAARDTAVLRAQKTKSPRIKELSDELGEIRASLETWAKGNRKEFEGQSLVFPLGILSFRVGNPEVAFLKGWNLKRVLGQMICRGKIVASWRPWVRIKFELNRQNILSDFAKKPDVTVKKLLPVGLEVSRGESFDVEFGVKQKL